MEDEKKRRGTKTSHFGSSGRESHDSSIFYSGKLYRNMVKEKKIKYKENSIKSEFLDKIHYKSSENMSELPDDCIHLVVTSPPYNVGKEYDSDHTLEEYLSVLERVWREVYRVLVPGGRVCINLANLGRKPYIPLHAYIIEIMNKIGFLMRGEVIWDKSASAGTSTAWGSWKSPSNPTLRDVHEYILIFSKYSFKRPQINKRQITISRDEFLEYTKSIWSFTTESAKKIGHPAPFPIELPYRCIQLYTYKKEIVLDPFMGSGQTAIATIESDRRYIGYEINKEYIEIAKKRILEFVNEFNRPKLSEFINKI